jgi:hypothetical protein
MGSISTEGANKPLTNFNICLKTGCLRSSKFTFVDSFSSTVELQDGNSLVNETNLTMS